jgi:hypothetical protein
MIRNMEKVLTHGLTVVSMRGCGIMVGSTDVENTFQGKVFREKVSGIMVKERNGLSRAKNEFNGISDRQE